jgi:hypothetical protein
MKRMGCSIAVACAFAVAAGAAQDKTDRHAKDDAKTVILTGCLQTRNPSARADANAAYILTNASASADTSSAAGSPSASSAPRPVIGKSGAKAGAGVDYRLEGMSSDLAKHAGKRVEVRGTIGAQGTIEDDPHAVTGTSGTNPMPFVHVKEVHTAAGDCGK